MSCLSGLPLRNEFPVLVVQTERPIIASGPTQPSFLLSPIVLGKGYLLFSCFAGWLLWDHWGGWSWINAQPVVVICLPLYAKTRCIPEHLAGWLAGWLGYHFLAE